jgi:hypothetical protein
MGMENKRCIEEKERQDKVIKQNKPFSELRVQKQRSHHVLDYFPEGRFTPRLSW